MLKECLNEFLIGSKTVFVVINWLRKHFKRRREEPSKFRSSTFSLCCNVCSFLSKGQFPVSGISRAGGILDNEMLLSRNNLFNFRATFSLVNKRISARSENSTDWKLALMPEPYSGERNFAENLLLVDYNRELNLEKHFAPAISCSA